ncbi:hypothetical protein IAQ61_007331 [Plenodomus lingam]|uniref:Uncharacterized protein n=1 Tax=Leptosphaeria maculans (strain JN3 / isolate v23.1.3 / race Av1-4-5-6-7-8) TaxID=985895 RepID=E5A0W1_LEPMJ|nr:hypothetical protein LEMA_P103880.1 [Plenodomus lingam JN3]KAH9868024.1 hypothetical protein IAQ61_007331 [Plenodomus lingam]CBX97257.1 hypothetical protein LEMA_P103880.1 [Plenodomus lingam JN3]
MRTASVFVALAALLTPFVAADLHHSGVCVNGKNVYNKDATVKACEAYLKRNTGNKQHEQCPDCVMKNIGNLDVCNSAGWHIGGKELSQYCKDAGASGSLAN